MLCAIPLHNPEQTEPNTTQISTIASTISPNSQQNVGIRAHITGWPRSRHSAGQENPRRAPERPGEAVAWGEREHPSMPDRKVKRGPDETTPARARTGKPPLVSVRARARRSSSPAASSSSSSARRRFWERAARARGERERERDREGERKGREGKGREGGEETVVWARFGESILFSSPSAVRWLCAYFFYYILLGYDLHCEPSDLKWTDLVGTGWVE